MICTAPSNCTVKRPSCTVPRYESWKLTFRPLKLADRAWAASLLQEEDPLSSDGCFGTLYLWGGAYGLQIARLGGRLILRYGMGSATYFGYPAGSGDLRPALLAMQQTALEQGAPLTLRGLTEAQKQRIERALPGRFSFWEKRDAADYIYGIEAMTTLSGKKLQSKRNHCNRFAQTYENWHFEPLEPRHAAACMALLEQWEAAHEAEKGGMKPAEKAAIARAFADWETLELEGGVLFAEAQPVAFTLGEAVGKTGFDVRFEKADTAYEGSYAMINREFARHLAAAHPQLEYLNREEDMGLENLRKAKLSYHPACLLMKYDARLVPQDPPAEG